MEDKILQYIKETKIDERLDKPYSISYNNNDKIGKTFITINEMIDVIKKNRLFTKSRKEYYNLLHCLQLFFNGYCINNKFVKENKIFEITIRYYMAEPYDYTCALMEEQFAFYDIKVI